MRATKEKIQQILSQTILTLCNNGLEFENELEVDGLLGITLDKREVMLVKISEVVQGAKQLNVYSEPHIYEDPPSTVSSPRSIPENFESSFPFGKRTFVTPCETVPSAKRQRHISAPCGTINRSKSRPTSPYQDFPQDLSIAKEHLKRSQSTLLTTEPLNLKSSIITTQPELNNSPKSNTIVNWKESHYEKEPNRVGEYSINHLQDVRVSQKIPGLRKSSLSKGTKIRPRSRTPDISSGGVISAPGLFPRQDLSFRKESKKVLTRAEERLLVDWVFERSSSKEGITVNGVLVEVKSWLDTEKRDTMYDNNMPTEEWFRDFLRRHPELYAIKWWS